MKKIVLWALAALTLTGCELGNLGFYLYPQAASSTGISEERATGPLAGLEVVGYLPAYKIPTIDPAQVRHLTDLVYFTLTPREDGDLYREALTPDRIDFLLKVKKEFGTRILIGVTDHNRQGALAAIVRKPSLRQKFAANLAGFLQEEGFDGADFDWEYPGTEDLASYAELFKEVRRTFGPLGLRLTVAVSPSRPLTKAAYDAVDRVHGMLYDDWGRHSTLENSTAHVQEMIDQGVDPAKLLLGVPFYGRGYTPSGPSWSSAVSYKTLKERYRLTPDQDTVSGYYFNGAETVRRKVRYAKSAGLSGVMVWEIGQDTSDDSSLLGAISEARKDLARTNEPGRL
jgi:GH18 family chitinase